MTENITPENEHSLKKLAFAITNSQGKFKLIFARCNYDQLQGTLLRRLQEICKVEITTISLNPDETTLFAAINHQIKSAYPKGLIVLDLAKVKHLDQMLSSANQVRENFRQNFSFPLVFWLNDPIKKKMMELAPDLESWGTSIQFDLGAENVINLLEQETENVFDQVISTPIDDLLYPQNSSNFDCQNIEIAVNDLENRGELLTAELTANFNFVLGQKAYF